MTQIDVVGRIVVTQIDVDATILPIVPLFALRDE